mgnify:FL=1
MNFQSRLKEDPEVNLTSLIDVVLLLLVFFMVSTNFVRETEILLRLPQVDNVVELDTLASTLEIIVTSEGDYLINGDLLPNNQKDTIRAAIEGLDIKVSEGPVSIKADADTKHQSVVTVMDVVGQLGFTEINISTAIIPGP